MRKLWINHVLPMLLLLGCSEAISAGSDVDDRLAPSDGPTQVEGVPAISASRPRLRAPATRIPQRSDAGAPDAASPTACLDELSRMDLQNYLFNVGFARIASGGFAWIRFFDSSNRVVGEERVNTLEHLGGFVYDPSLAATDHVALMVDPDNDGMCDVDRVWMGRYQSAYNSFDIPTAGPTNVHDCSAFPNRVTRDNATVHVSGSGFPTSADPADIFAISARAHGFVRGTTLGKIAPDGRFEFTFEIPAGGNYALDFMLGPYPSFNCWRIPLCDAQGEQTVALRFTDPQSGIACSLAAFEGAADGTP